MTEAKRSRLAVSVNGLAEQWNGPDIVAARKLVAKIGDPRALAKAFVDGLNTGNDDYYVLVREPNFYENLGLLARSDKGLITQRSAQFRLIKRFLGSVIVNRFDYWKPAIDQLRDAEKAKNRPVKKKWYQRKSRGDLAFAEFELLAERLRKKLRMSDAKENPDAP